MVKLKRFFIGYFSNNYLKESCSDGLLGTMLSLLLTLIIIFCGILGGELLPFGVRYAHATEYKETLGALFSDITLNISEGRAEVNGGNGGQTPCLHEGLLEVRGRDFPPFSRRRDLPP